MSPATIAVRLRVAALAHPLTVVLFFALFALGGPRPKAVAQSQPEGQPESHQRTADRPALSELQALQGEVFRVIRSALAWYQHTPPLDRSTWGGLAACVALGIVILVERTFRLRRRWIIPADFTAKFLDRLYEGKLDGSKALDYCEMNPSPAARVAVAAVRRWGRPAVDLERAVTLAHRVETEKLRRNVGTLRRIAALAPLLGLLGTLLAIGRALAAVPGTGPLPGAEAANSVSVWGPAISAAISPLTLGVVIATLALAAYDALQVRIERLAGALDRLGAETIDAIALATQPAATGILTAPAQTRREEWHSRHEHGSPVAAGPPHHPSGGTPLVGSGRAPAECQDVEVEDSRRRHAPNRPEIGF